MAVADFRISDDLGHLMPSGSPLTREAFPTLAFAVRRIAQAVHQQWVAYASGAPLPDGKTIRNRTGDYARSIQIRELGDLMPMLRSTRASSRPNFTGG